MRNWTLFTALFLLLGFSSRVSAEDFAPNSTDEIADVSTDEGADQEAESPACSPDSGCLSNRRCVAVSPTLHRCVSAASATCRSAPDCIRAGRCWAQDGTCVARFAADCTHSKRCLGKTCQVVEGRCEPVIDGPVPTKEKPIEELVGASPNDPGVIGVIGTSSGSGALGFGGTDDRTKQGIRDVRRGQAPGPSKGGAEVESKGRSGYPSGGLSTSTIRRVINMHRRQFRFCYEMYLQKNPKLAGTVTVTFTVSPLGRVTAAEITKNSLAEPKVGLCVHARVVSLRFPRSKLGGATQVTYPFVFKAK